VIQKKIFDHNFDDLIAQMTPRQALSAFLKYQSKRVVFHPSTLDESKFHQELGRT